MPYRRDVDGLRALAVVLVILFHAHVPGFEGGFVGVDVFFVISGFLITAIAARAADEGRFRVRDFWVRRIRRILPAFVVMAVVVAVAASVVLLPGALEEFGRSLVAAGAMLSNVFFVTRGGYFAAGAESAPLLHTWSLGVEEQFYLGFPIAMLLLARFVPRRRWLGVVGLLGVLSFLANLWLTARRPDVAFYLPVTRAWQFLAGSGLALVARTPQRWAARSALGVAGIAAIATAATAFDADVAYPGAAAVLPTLGAVMVIVAGRPAAGRSSRPTPAEVALEWAPMVGVGLVSYSLYLWHWPALVLAREATVDQRLTWPATAAVLVGSLALAVLSWRWVEVPMRRWRPPAWRAVAFGAAVSVLAVAGGVALWRSTGLPDRYEADVTAIEALAGQTSRDVRVCDDPALGGLEGLCHHGPNRAPVTLAVWGDSHAATVLPALVDVAATRDEAVLGATRPVCPPTTTLGTRFVAGDMFRCAEFNGVVIDRLLAEPDLTDVVLVARWSAYETWLPGPLEPAVEYALVDGTGTPIVPARRLAALGEALQGTVDQLEAAGLRVHVVYPSPSYPFNVARAVARTRALDADLDALAVERPMVEDAEEAAVAMLDGIRLGSGSTRIDPVEVLCDATVCSPHRDGHPLFSDDDHLTLAGAALVSAAIDASLTGRSSPGPARAPTEVSGPADPAPGPGAGPPPTPSSDPSGTPPAQPIDVPTPPTPDLPVPEPSPDLLEDCGPTQEVVDGLCVDVPGPVAPPGVPDLP